MTSKRRRWAAAAALGAVLALPILIVPPRGDHPIDDDFDYAASAFHLAETGRLGLTDWPSMTLVAHVGWGAGFVRLIGASHETLRFSTLVLAAAGALALARIALRRSERDAVFFGAWFYLNPLTLALAYTFMTDLPAAAVTLIGLAWLGRDGLGGALGAGLIGAWGLLIRQTGAVWAIAAAIALPFSSTDRKKGFLQASLIVASLVIAWATYRWWLASHGGPPWNATRWQLAFEPLFHPKLLIAKGLCLALGVGLYLAPAALWRATPDDFRRRRFVIAAAILAGLLVAGRRQLRVHEGTELRDLALGNAARIQGEDALRGPAIGDLSLFETTVFVLGVAGLFACLAVALRPNAIGIPSTPAERTIRTVAMLTLLLTAGIYLVVESWFDRYYLALIAPVGVWLALTPPPRSSKFFQIFGGALLFLYAATAVLGVQDAQQRSVTVWRTTSELEASGVPPDQINACFEHTAVRTYLPLYWRGGAPARPFLTTLPVAEQSAERERRMPDRRIVLPWREYTLSWRPLPGLLIEQEVAWESWWRRGTLYVLRKPPERRGG